MILYHVVQLIYPTAMTIVCALLGCGLFAQDVYVRLFKEYEGRCSLKLAWSRSQEASTVFVAK